MSVQDLIAFIRGLGINTKIYPTEFPHNDKGEAMLIEFAQTFNSRGAVYDGSFTITVRAQHPQQAEALSLDLIDKLKLVTDATVGEMQIIQIKSQNILPSYIGKDNKSNYYYMNTFTVLLT